MNNQPIVNLNTAIPGWAKGVNSTESLVYVADVYNAPYPPTALRDGVHPNDEGDNIIAKTVGPLLIKLIQDYQAGSNGKVARSFIA
jgi:lysophospholipase L1-like esterase